MGNFDKILSEFILREAISLKNVKKHNLRKSHSGAYTHNLDKIFGKNKSRIVIPIDIDLPENNHVLFNKINELLSKHNYTVLNMERYIKGMAYKMTSKMELDMFNPVKIGKLLQKYEPDGEIEITQRVDGKKTTKTVTGKPLLHEFKNDPIRVSGGQFLIVISRHPYDIAGASTDRSWTSCMDLGFPRIQYPKTNPNTGINKKYIQRDIDEGTLVAYLITKSETIKEINGEPKVSLHKPLSRILIKPHPADDRTVYTLGQTYGGHYSKFRNKVQEWVSATFHSNPSTIGKVYPNNKLYSDWDYETLPDFKFNAGNTIADEILNDALSYNNEKELGNNLTFKTEDHNNGSRVSVEVSLEFNNIVLDTPIDYLLGKSKRHINTTSSNIHKQILTSIFKQLPNIEVSVYFYTETNTINIEMREEVEIYSYDDKYIDDDYIWDTLNYRLSDYKKLNYKKLNFEIKKIIESYDWDAHHKKNKERLEQCVQAMSNLLDVQLTTPSSPILKELKIIPPEKFINQSQTANEYLDLIYKINTKFVVLIDVLRTFELSMPSSIKNNEEYDQSIQELYDTKFKQYFKIDLVKIKNDIHTNWNLIKIFHLRDNTESLTSESWEEIRDIKNELFQVERRIKYLIGDLGEEKI